MNSLSKKIEKTGDVARKEGSSDLNMYNKLVEEIILGQEDQPGTHSTGAESAH